MRALWIAGRLLVACCALAVLTLLAPRAGASQTAPYTDPSADGYIGLCNTAGQQITSGSVYTDPFAWRAVSSVAAPAPYDNDWRTAILLAYQPQNGLEPGEWSGDELTASSRYSNPAHPMVAATRADDSLADFIQEFRPVWDGFLQLRIYLGTQNAQVYSERYPVLNIHVVGNTWHAVGGGRVNCHSGTAESLESIVLPKSETATPQPTHRLKPVAATVTASTGSGRPPVLLITVGALVVVIGGALLLLRRRHLLVQPANGAASHRPPRKGHRP